MKIAKAMKDGRFMSITTRKANYVNAFYGTCSIWPSQAAYQHGDVEGVITHTNIYLGNNRETLLVKIQEWISKYYIAY